MLPHVQTIQAGVLSIQNAAAVIPVPWRRSFFASPPPFPRLRKVSLTCILHLQSAEPTKGLENKRIPRRKGYYYTWFKCLNRRGTWNAAGGTRAWIFWKGFPLLVVNDGKIPPSELEQIRTEQIKKRDRWGNDLRLIEDCHGEIWKRNRHFGQPSVAPSRQTGT